jgi:hypothetical protein
MPAAHLQQSVCNHPVPIKLTLVKQQPKKPAEPAAARFVVFRPELPAEATCCGVVFNEDESSSERRRACPA